MTQAAATFTTFETAIGVCAIAWGTNGIVAVQLPEPNPAATIRRLIKRLPLATPGHAPPAVQITIDEIVRLLQGEPLDLRSVELDQHQLPDFNRQVYDLARRVPPGATSTYGELARSLGDPLLARAVGQALGQNPFPIIVPCHRIVATGGAMGGFSAPGGVATKWRMLQIEQAPIAAQLSLL